MAGRSPRRRVPRAPRRGQPDRRFALGHAARVGTRARVRRMAQHLVARAVRRPRRDVHAGGHLPDRARPGARALLGRGERARPARSDPVAARHRGTEAALPPAIIARRGVLGSGLQRAQRRFRPRVAAHAAPSSTATRGSSTARRSG